MGIKAPAVHRGALFKGDRPVARGGGGGVHHGHDRHVHVNPEIILGKSRVNLAAQKFNCVKSTSCYACLFAATDSAVCFARKVTILQNRNMKIFRAIKIKILKLVNNIFLKYTRERL